MKNIEYCCSSFEWLISDVGNKGFSAFPTLINDKVCFILNGSNQNYDTKTEILTTFQMKINYCPHCGSNLNLVINKNREQLIELIKYNERFNLKF